MTPEELVCLFRSDIEDEDDDDPLWSDDEVYSYMDESQKEFARGTDYFSDGTTASITTVTVTATNPLITLSNRVTKIRSGRLVSNNYPLKAVLYDTVNQTGYGIDAYASSAFSSFSDWETATGPPTLIITDFERGKGRLVPIPTANDTIQLRVYRLPLADLDEDATGFEIEEVEYQRGLMHYMKYLAYLKNDSDVYSPQLSEAGMENHIKFIDQTKRNIRRLRFGSTTGTVRYAGY